MGEEEMIRQIYEKVCFDDELKMNMNILINENKMLKQQNEMLMQILNKESK